MFWGEGEKPYYADRVNMTVRELVRVGPVKNPLEDQAQEQVIA